MTKRKGPLFWLALLLAAAPIMALFVMMVIDMGWTVLLMYAGIGIWIAAVSYVMPRRIGAP